MPSARKKSVEKKKIAHLKKETQAWVLETVEMYDLNWSQVEILIGAAGYRERAEELRILLAENGLTYEDEKGNGRSRPEEAMQRLADKMYWSGMRELNFDRPESERGRKPRPASNSYR